MQCLLLMPSAYHFLAEATGVEPAHDNARRFSKPLPYRFGDASLVRQDAGAGKSLLPPGPASSYFFLAGTPGFEPRKSGLESEGLPVSLRPI